MNDGNEPEVTVAESGNGPLGQMVVVGHHVMGADEPEDSGGRDTGPTPYQFLQAALGACTSMTIRLYAERKKWAVTNISVSLRHEKIPAPDGRGKIDRFERTITLAGDLTDEQKIRLLEVAGKCPVSQTLSRGSEIASRIEMAKPR
jgi:putative redox protein